MKTEFIRHLFVTLTYSRDIPLSSRWDTVSKDYNRYIQRVRRFHLCKVQYLRVVESHSDGYPHIHIIMQMPDARIRVDNSRYFDRKLYQHWKSLWPHGHSDYQRPRRRGAGRIGYLLKYLTKNATSKTIWKKVFAPIADVPSSSPIMVTPHVKSTVVPVSHLGIKLATWSRDFDFTPFFATKKHIALSSRLEVTHDDTA